MPADSHLVTLTVWRDAKTEPPNLGSRVLVYPFGPAGSQVFAYRSGLDDKYKMWSEPHGTLDPQPSVWCDPVPPSEDALTLDDLRAHRQVVIRDTGHWRPVDSGWLEAEERWTVSHLRTAIALIERGLAFAWIPESSIRAELARGELRPLPLESGGHRPETLYLVFADPTGAGPATQALGVCLRERAQAFQGMDRGV